MTSPGSSASWSAVATNGPNSRTMPARVRSDGGHEPPEAPAPEALQRDRARALVLDQEQGGDQVPRQGEEGRHPEVAADRPREPGVEEQDAGHGDAPEAVECGLVGERRDRARLASRPAAGQARRDGTARVRRSMRTGWARSEGVVGVSTNATGSRDPTSRPEAARSTLEGGRRRARRRARAWKTRGRRAGTEGLGDQLQDGRREADEGGVAAEVLAGEQQGVALLEVVHGGHRRAQVGVGDPGAPDQADLPAAAAGPQAQVGFLAVAEVALVEQADVVEAGPTGQQQRAVRVVDGLPALGDRRRAGRACRSSGRPPG